MAPPHAPLPSRRAFLHSVFAAVAGIGLACLTPPAKRRQAKASAARPPLANGEQYLADVTHFGAEGDGSTDDAPAFQAAVDSLRHTRGRVVFPAGETNAFLRLSKETS